MGDFGNLLSGSTAPAFKVPKGWSMLSTKQTRLVTGLALTCSLFMPISVPYQAWIDANGKKHVVNTEVSKCRGDTIPINLPGSFWCHQAPHSTSPFPHKRMRDHMRRNTLVGPAPIFRLRRCRHRIFPWSSKARRARYLVDVGSFFFLQFSVKSSQ